MTLEEIIKLNKKFIKSYIPNFIITASPYSQIDKRTERTVMVVKKEEDNESNIWNHRSKQIDNN